jgi:hypothetical protein
VPTAGETVRQAIRRHLGAGPHTAHDLSALAETRHSVRNTGGAVACWLYGYRRA